jgi:glutamyl-tRNA synthetase
MTRVRFAIAPSANLTLNSARAALANQLFARRANGRLVLRLDDLDAAKCSAAQAEQIAQDLRWFGIECDDTLRQSERLPLYQETIERLQRDGFLYPCFESEEELRAKQEFRRKRGQSQVYDRAMLKLTAKQRHDAEAGGKRPHWRLKLSGRTMEWRDMILGPRRVVLSSVSDPVLVAADGTPGPLLASVVDDIDTGTTHVIRSEDSAGNTAIQIELVEILTGGPCGVPFAHVPALGGAGSDARRAGNMAMRALRADGIEPEAIAACLTGHEPMERAALMGVFRLRDMAASDFDASRLLGANRTVLRGLDYAAVAARLPGGATEAFWNAVRGNLDLLKEARGWWDVVAGSIVPPVIEGERDLLLLAESLLPAEPWDRSVWRTWIAALEHGAGRTGEALLAPLRLALTGEEDGPELAELLPLIGRARAANRLVIAAA